MEKQKVKKQGENMKRIIDKINMKKLKYISIIVIVFMIIAHGYIYFNTIYSHDSMKTYFWDENIKVDTISIGRFIIPLYLLVRGKYYPPLIIGILSTIFMIGLIYVLTSLLEIKKKSSIILTTGILSTSATITLLNATYIDFSDVYILSFLLSTLGVYFQRKGRKYYPISILLFIVSMGIYQSSLTIFTSLIIFISIIDLLHKKDYKKVWKEGLESLVIILISLGIYYLIYKAILILFQITPEKTYNSITNIGGYGGKRAMIKTLINTYKKTFDYLINPSTQY